MLPDDKDDQSDDDVKDYGFPIKKERVVEPLHGPGTHSDNPAVNIIRGKIDALYAEEPDTKAELSEAKAAHQPFSKHQKFMLDLSNSGKSLAEIQTAWHNYYLGLADSEKHQVWQEFYDNHSRNWPVAEHKQPHKTPEPEPKPITKSIYRPGHPRAKDSRSAADIKHRLADKVAGRVIQKTKRHRSILFGLSMGLAVVFIMLFGFFNERFIAPFITPSRSVSSTPIIVDAAEAVGPEAKLIIPKINVEVPVVYDEPSVDEHAIQKALQNGVVHYATTQSPGEKGNAVIFGHSSNNILNRGKYKFAFVLLNKLEQGDTFMLNYQGKRYIYKVAERKIVKPDDLSVLEKTALPATMTLITCDPPGTALNRLVVVGEQISPDPSTNVASSVNSANARQPRILPSNAPSLWSRLVQWFTS